MNELSYGPLRRLHYLLHFVYIAVLTRFPLVLYVLLGLGVPLGSGDALVVLI